MRLLRPKSEADARPMRPHQYANDWITGTYLDDESPAGPFSPTQVILDIDDWPSFASRDPDHPHHHRVGTFWREWRLNDDGTFSRNTSSRSRVAELERYA